MAAAGWDVDEAEGEVGGRSGGGSLADGGSGAGTGGKEKAGSINIELWMFIL